MRRFWADVTEPILRGKGFSRVVEIGSQSGESTLRLLELCKEFDAHAHVIDPVPPKNQNELETLLATHGTLHVARSLDVLGEIPVADTYLIDGDHNYYTVRNELFTIARRVDEMKSPYPLILMHDVGWPYGRRDQYYTPENVPEEGLRPFIQGGLHPDRSEADPEGGLNRHQIHAREEGGPKNGVRTAVDDFLAEHPGLYEWWSIPVFHGYGCLLPIVDRERPHGQFILQLCTANPALLALVDRVERSRAKTLIDLETVRHVKRTREHVYSRQLRILRARIAELEGQLETIQESRGYKALEGARDVRRRVLRWRREQQ